MARLHKFYREQVVTQLMDQFKYGSVMEVPKITKVTINMGLGKALGDKKVMESAVKELAEISGQRPVVTKARKSIAAPFWTTGLEDRLGRNPCQTSTEERYIVRSILMGT